MIAATQPISSRTGLAPWDTTLLLTGHFRDKELTEQSHRALFPGLVEDVGVWNCLGAMWRLSGISHRNCEIQGSQFLRAFTLAFLTYGMWQCPISVGPAQILRKVLEVKRVGKEDTVQVV